MKIKSGFRNYLIWWYRTWYLEMFTPKRLFQSLLIALFGIVFFLIIIAQFLPENQ